MIQYLLRDIQSGVAEDSSLLGCYAVSYFEVIHIGLLDPEDKCTVISRHFGTRLMNIRTSHCTIVQS